MILLVMGVTGSGKTTVGKLLAQRLGWLFLDADDFHPAENIEKMKHGVALTDEDREPWLGESVASFGRMSDRTTSDRELLRWRITMLFAPNPAVIFFCCLEQLEMAITRRRSASLPERLHLLRRHRMEAARNSNVLTQHVQRIGAANCGRHGQTHRVAQRLFCPDDAVLDRLAVAPQALHAESGNAAAVKLR